MTPNMTREHYFFNRAATADCPAGWTVTKRPSLPDGDFGITEYLFGDTALWFCDDDHFNADERQAAYEAYRAGKKDSPTETPWLRSDCQRGPNGFLRR